MDDETLNSQELQESYEFSKNSLRRKQKERKIRKKRKKLNRLKSFLRLILFWGLIFLIYKSVTLSGWYFLPDAFTNRESDIIKIYNNKIVPTNIIYNQIENVEVPKEPIFLFRVDKIKHEIFKIPVIKKVYVRRYGFPARLQIIVEERVPIVQLKTDIKSKPFGFFTSDNILITNKNYMNLPKNNHILTILVKPMFQKNNWTKKNFDKMREIASEVETYSGEKVEYIDIRKNNDVYVKIKSTNVRLGALDSTVYERIKRIYTILPQIQSLKGKVRYIDLSWDKVNYIKLNVKNEQK